MLRRFEAELRLPDGARAPSSMGSILHGALIEQLPEDYADYLHTENLRPYSQSVRWDRERERVIWRIGTLDRTAGEIIGAVLQSLEHIHLRQKGYTVDVQNIQCVEARSYQDIADEYFRAEIAPRGAEIHFLTPTSFKQGGAYILLPESVLILQSLLLRWNAFCPDIRIEEDNLAQELAAHIHLTRYALRSAAYSVEGYNIRGFRGQIALRFTGSDMVRRILGTLLAFAPYAGLGIKTALGMGAVETDIWKG
ncbi:CRISPR system precrRNA processing endoribonuclease RAMP protein Cas6 [uncultured Selenomonas sp.]|uniref:CRISPR system precrRNA processing endoribonuclease RAMP protein Cas6 n=1 Tax=uncultured Selenomonas sp. TaxID=159275 RepID=UPI0028E50B79|nr:CRISPR system precrRNA processing endoribonuclease RAMP protein Cas6 [uncultured Selenomonas sp.]